MSARGNIGSSHRGQIKVAEAAATLLTVPIHSDLGLLALALRREVFIHEQKVPADEEFDAADFTSTHVVALVEGNVAGTLRFIFTPEHVKIGRVAVRREQRGRGIAAGMMRWAMDFARARGESRFYLAAQIDKLGFYERFGFRAFGEQFDDGGMPHRSMKTY
jgi:predicted GNAT family N-acyltransferase